MLPLQTGKIKISEKKKQKRKRVPKNTSQRGAIYIGRIPHGFYEDQLKSYFDQFGIVSRVKLARSKRTGRSKGYAFVEFYSSEVAKVAAEAMNNYLMFNCILKCEYRKMCFGLYILNFLEIYSNLQCCHFRQIHSTRRI